MKANNIKNIHCFDINYLMNNIENKITSYNNLYQLYMNRNYNNNYSNKNNINNQYCKHICTIILLDKKTFFTFVVLFTLRYLYNN